MSTRSTRRISRELLIGLSFMLMLALVFGAYNLGKGQGAADAGSSERPKVASSITMNETPIKSVTPSAPPVAPATRAASSDLATTQPSAPLLGAVRDQPVPTGTTTRPADSAQLARETARRTPSGTPLADAKSLIDAGKLLDARRVLNTALVSRSVPEHDVPLVKQTLNEINEVIVFSSKRFADDELGELFDVPSGGALERIASRFGVTPQLLMRLNGITDPRRLQAGQTIKVIRGPFHAVVDKSDFTLELWLGEPETTSGFYITSFPVGLGADDSTPTGVWTVTDSLTNPTYYSPRGEGIIDADDPKNPLGEYWIGLVGTGGHAVGKQSYGIHGTIEPESIGKMESMGCIRLTNDNVARLYEVLVKGKSTVTVRE